MRLNENKLKRIQFPHWVYNQAGYNSLPLSNICYFKIILFLDKFQKGKMKHTIISHNHKQCYTLKSFVTDFNILMLTINYKIH